MINCEVKNNYGRNGGIYAYNHAQEQQKAKQNIKIGAVTEDLEKEEPENILKRKKTSAIGYKNEGIRRKKFISQATGKVEDEYITGLLKEEWIDYKR